MWIIKGEESHEIISCNIFSENDKHQLWVTRPNGKNLKIDESTDKSKIEELKEAIDYAIEHKESALRLV